MEDKEKHQSEKLKDEETPPKEEAVKETNETKDVEKKPKKKKKPTKDDEIKALKGEIASLEDRLLRNEAELQNFKRRMTEERIKDRKYARIDLIRDLLSPLDNFERGLEKESSNDALKKHIKGFDMILKEILETLKKDGLETIEAEGVPFDPTVHHAVAKEPTEGVESDHVIEVYQKGYKYKDRVIRPAMVKVSE